MEGDGWDRRPPNAGFRLGFVGGLVVVGVIAALGFVTQNWNTADRLGRLTALVVVLIVARQAAGRQYRQQRASANPARNVRGAGVGAALITVLVMWLFIFARDVARDQPGAFTLTSCVRVPLDVALAVGLGHLAAGGVARRHERSDAYF